MDEITEIRSGCEDRRKKNLKMKHSNGCDSELNHESTQNQMPFAWVISWFESKNKEALWVMSQAESIPGKPTWAMSWFWVTSCKAAWVMSWIDSSLWDTAWVMIWFESRHMTRMHKKYQRRLVKAQTRSTKFNKSPQKDQRNWVKALKGQGNQQLIRIIDSWHDSNHIPDSFWVESKLWKVFLSLELSWMKISWNLFESWVNLNQISEIHFESWAYLNQFL